MAELRSLSLFTDTNLQAYWRLEGNSSDSKGSNNGTDTNIAYSQANGKFGQGAGFGGSSKIVLADATSLKPSGNYTVTFWFKYTGNTNGQIFLQSWSENTNVAGFRIYTGQSGATVGVNLTLDHGNNTGTSEGTNYKNVVGTKVVNDNVWHMGTIIYDGAKLSIYVDAVLDNSVSWTTNAAYAATTYPRIGCGNNSGTDNGFYTGALDDMALFNRALSVAEIASLYAAGSALFYSYI